MKVAYDAEWHRNEAKVWIIGNRRDKFNPEIMKVVEGRLEGEFYPEGRYDSEIPPTFSMHLRDFEELTKAWAEVAWERGWRPKDYIPNDATLRHLEDMRKIVAKKLGVEL